MTAAPPPHTAPQPPPDPRRPPGRTTLGDTGPDGLPGAPFVPPRDPRPRRPPGRAPDPGSRPDPAGAAGPRVRLTGTEDLIAAIPVLIGFHPQDSLVLVGMAGPEQRGRVGLTLRVDLPRPGEVHRVCAAAVTALAGSGPARAVAVVVRRRNPAAASRPVRRDVAVGIRRALQRAGIEPLAVLWSAGTHLGDAWACFELPGQWCRCSGTVPDPSATPAAAAAALRGRRVLPDRAAVAAQLDGDPGELARRARLRTAMPESLPGAPSGGAPSGLLERSLWAAATGRLTVDDALALAFCAAFDTAGFADEAVRHCLGPHAPHAEQLWAVLCRAMPAPERADAAALLAACALLRGDGALATLAVERALDDRPDHALASLVDASLRSVLGSGAEGWPYPGPDGLRALLGELHPEPGEPGLPAPPGSAAR